MFLFSFKSLVLLQMGQYQTRHVNFHSNGWETFMKNVQVLESTIEEGFGAQPKRGLLIIRKIQRRGDIAATIVLDTKV